MVLDTLAFTECCQRIVKYCPDEYAKAYARAGLTITNREEMIGQVPYLLSNLSKWRGEMARIVRHTLRQFIDGKE